MDKIEKEYLMSKRWITIFSNKSMKLNKGNLFLNRYL